MKQSNLEGLWQMFCLFEVEKWKSFSHCLDLANILKGFNENNPIKPIYGNNVLVYLNPTEPKTSWIIREILAYREKKSYPLLQNFLNYFFDNEYEVDNPKITAEIERIDVLVKDSKYVLIIENKLKGAVYQKYQLARYISRLKKQHPNKAILLALIPNNISESYVDLIPMSVWRLPAIGCECNFRCNESKELSICDLCHDYKNESKIKVLTTNFAEWLSSVIKTTPIPERETRIISTINQFSDYLNQIYKIDKNKDYYMEVQNFLKQQLNLNGQDIESIGNDLEKLQEKIDDIKVLQDSLMKLYESEEKEFINKCYQKIKDEYPNLRHNRQHPNRQGWETGIEIEYRGITMWAHINSRNFDTNKPRWGVWLQNVTDEQINSINIEILDKLDGKLELVRCFNTCAQLFIPSDYSSVYDEWKELMDVILEAKRKNE